MENRNSFLSINLALQGPFLVFDLSPYRRCGLHGTRRECDDTQHSLVLSLLLILQLE